MTDQGKLFPSLTPDERKFYGSQLVKQTKTLWGKIRPYLKFRNLNGAAEGGTPKPAIEIGIKGEF